MAETMSIPPLPSGFRPINNSSLPPLPSGFRPIESKPAAKSPGTGEPDLGAGLEDVPDMQGDFKAVDTADPAQQPVDPEQTRPIEGPDFTRMSKRAGAAAVNYLKTGAETLLAGSASYSRAERGLVADSESAHPVSQMIEDAKQPAIDMGPPRDFWDKVADTAGALAPQVAELVGMNLVVPGAGLAKNAFKGGSLAAKALKAGGAVARSAAMFEAQSLAHGSEPGHGATLGTAFGAIEVIPGASIPAKIAKTVLESATLGTATKLQGGEPDDIAIAMAIPFGFKAGGKAVEGLSKLIRGEAKLAEKPSRMAMKELGLDEVRMDSDQRAGLAVAVEAVKKPRVRMVIGEDGKTTFVPIEAKPEKPATSSEILSATATEGAEPTQSTPRGETGAENAPARQFQALTKGEFGPQLPIRVDDVSGSVRRGLSRGAALVRNLFTTRGDLPDTAFRAKVSKDGRVNAAMLDIDYASRDYKRATREAYGRKSTEAEDFQANQALAGQVPIESLPEPLRPVIKSMRDNVDALSRRLIDEGVIEGDLVATVEGNMGTYLNRAYRAFTDPAWADKVDQTVKNKARSLLRSEMPEATEAEIEGALQKLLYVGKAADSPIAIIHRAKLGDKDLSILTRRKEIPPEIRDLWGEYQTPLATYSLSVAKMSHLLANDRMLKDIRAAGDGVFLFDKPIVNEAGRFIEPVAPEGDVSMRPLAGLHTTPEIAAAFREWYTPAANDWFNWTLRQYLRANGIVKLGKTAYSWNTQVRNHFANYLLLVGNGHLPWKWGGSGALDAMRAKLGVKDTKATRDYLRELTELGIVGDSVNAGELRTFLDQSTDYASKPMSAKVAKGASRQAVEFYELGDEVPKVMAYEAELARYRKAMPDIPEPELKRIVADVIRDTFPTFSLLPKAVRMWRSQPVFGTFVSFPAAIARAAYKTVTLAKREIADPRLRSIGLQRATGFMLAATIPTAMAMWSRHINGISRKDDDDLREFVADWNKNSTLLYIGRQDQDRLKAIDISYIDPYGYLKRPMMAMLRGAQEGEWSKAIIDAVAEAAQPFAQQEILAERIMDISRNVKANGAPVYNPQSPFEDKLQASLAHLKPAFEFGVITSGQRVIKGMRGEVSTSGRAYDLKRELTAALTGQRIVDIDVKQSLAYKAGKLQRDLANATAIYTSVANRRGSVEPDEITAAHGTMETARKRIFANMQEAVTAARRLGLDSDEIASILDKNGASKEFAEAVTVGEYKPYANTETMMKLPGYKDTPEGDKAINAQAAKWLYTSVAPEPDRKVKTRPDGSKVYAESREEYAKRVGEWKEQRASAEQKLSLADLPAYRKKELLKAEMKRRGLNPSGQAAQERLRQIR